MPFTPLHMGPALVIKAVVRRKFSLMVFGWSQIIIDIQPLYVMLTGRGELHGFSHTYIGASLLGFFSAVSGKYLGEFGLRVLRKTTHLPISWPVSFFAAFVGTYSHVVIDSIMHSDMQPFYPFGVDSPLHGMISIDALHGWCLGTAIVGGLSYVVVGRYLR